MDTAPVCKPTVLGASGARKELGFLGPRMRVVPKLVRPQCLHVVHALPLHPPSKGLPQAASQSSRQPLCAGNGVHRQGIGSQGAQGQMRLRDHQVMPLPSKQGPPGWGVPTSSEPVSTAWPMPGSVSPGLGRAGALPRAEPPEIGEESRAEVRPGTAAGPALCPPGPGQWGLVVPQPPGLSCTHFLSSSRVAPLSANRAGCLCCQDGVGPLKSVWGAPGPPFARWPLAHRCRLDALGLKLSPQPPPFCHFPSPGRAPPNQQFKSGCGPRPGSGLPQLCPLVCGPGESPRPAWVPAL